MAFSTLSAPTYDPLLLPFLDDSNKTSRSFDDLLRQHVDPIIAATVHRYIPGKNIGTCGDMEEVRSETVRQLIIRLHNSTAPIHDFRAYVKVTARHVCWHHKRKTQNEIPVSSWYISCDDNPICLDETLLSEVDVEQVVGQHEMLRAIWQEIHLLPSMQRMALLLQFRSPDGGSGFCFLAGMLKASREEMAGILGMHLSELDELLCLLPLEDSAIAERLGRSGREVQNLRISSRRRLQRRLGVWLDPK